MLLPIFVCLVKAIVKWIVQHTRRICSILLIHSCDVVGERTQGVYSRPTEVHSMWIGAPGA